MFNTYCWMYGHLNLPHEYMVSMMMMVMMMTMMTMMAMMVMMLMRMRMMMMIMMMIIMLQGHCTRKQPDKSILYNTYYQWVSIFLMAQVLIFIILIIKKEIIAANNVINHMEGVPLLPASNDLALNGGWTYGFPL